MESLFEFSVLHWFFEFSSIGILDLNIKKLKLLKLIPHFIAGNFCFVACWKLID